MTSRYVTSRSGVDATEERTSTWYVTSQRIKRTGRESGMKKSQRICCRRKAQDEEQR
uniref:Uncharacterized protein n=1 Tax=Ciona intestinalis TaxID=7719 RepID=H2XKY8_CIOIN